MKPDHYLGRKVLGAEIYGTENWEWAIKFDGDVLFKNSDKRRTKMPEGIGALAFLRVQESDDGNTTLIFGSIRPDGTASIGESVQLTTTQYSISTPDNTAEVFPGRPVEEDESLPEDPSGDRVADGPENAEEEE